VKSLYLEIMDSRLLERQLYTKLGYWETCHFSIGTCGTQPSFPRMTGILPVLPASLNSSGDNSGDCRSQSFVVIVLHYHVISLKSNCLKSPLCRMAVFQLPCVSMHMVLLQRLSYYRGCVSMHISSKRKSGFLFCDI